MAYPHDYLQVLVEHTQLKEAVEKLEVFIKEAKEMPTELEYEMLLAQLGAMQAYYHVLNVRLNVVAERSRQQDTTNKVEPVQVETEEVAKDGCVND
jgi:cell division septum initiation protein DivIVA